jgi:hypothetical protein
MTACKAVAIARLMRICIIAVPAAALGCRGAPSDIDPKPIPECLEYEAALAHCGVKMTVAHQPTTEPRSDEDRQKIARLCALNTKRARLACH